jgi:hypothetical protein
MIKRNGDHWQVAPKTLAGAIGTVLASIILATASAIKAFNIDDDDRYRGADARRDMLDVRKEIGMVERRLDAMRIDLQAHKAQDWHSKTGEDLSRLEERMDSIRREHRWLRSRNGEDFE